MKIAVLGGGITGLTLSSLLQEKGHSVTCFEASPRAGGLCQSEVDRGFVMDRAGGHILFSKDKEVLQWMLGLLGPGGYTTCERQTKIWCRGRYVHYPFENGLGDLPPADQLVCLKDYIEASFARRNGAPAPTNFHDWCLWRFGRGVCDTFMHPYNQKIWNVDLHELGTKWVEGRVPDAPLEDVLRGALGMPSEGYVHQSIFHYPLERGFEALILALVARLRPGVLRTNTPVHSVTRMEPGFAVNGERFDRVLSTVPLPVLGKLLAALSDAERDLFVGLDSMSVLTVFLALDRPSVPPHSWIYFPSEEDGPQNRITYLSNYSPKNAPAGKTSIMAEVTYLNRLPKSESAITEEVIAGLARGGFLEPSQVMFARTFTNSYGYILYRLGLEERLESVRAIVRRQGIDVVGRFGNYNYFNSDACVRAAFDLARTIA